MKDRNSARGLYRITDAIADAYMAGDDEALADAIERMMMRTGYDRRAGRRLWYAGTKVDK